MSTADKTLRLDRTQLNQRRPDPRSRNLILAIVAGCLAAGLAFFVVNHATPPPAPAAPPPPVDIVVASRDIPVRAKITSDMVQVKKFDKKDVPPNAISIPDSAIGKIATDVIATGQPITNDHLTQASVGVGLEMAVPRGMRAVTIALDPVSSVANFLQPGNHVDVIATFDRDGRPFTRTVLQDVVLLATGANVEPNRPGADQNNNALIGNSGTAAPGAPDGRTPKPTEIPNATVILSPEDSEKIIMVAERSRLRLALRSEGDTAKTNVPAMDGSSVFGMSRPTAPPQAKTAAAPTIYAAPPAPQIPTAMKPIAAPPAPPTINVIKGSSPSSVSVNN